MKTKEEIAATRKVWYEANKEELLAKQKVYNEANKVHRAAVAKVRYDTKREDILAQKRAYHVANRVAIRARMKAARDGRNLMIFEHKGGKCQHCDLRDLEHLQIYDYHHTDPSTKLYTIACIMSGTIDRLMTEVDKCILLCANCHRKEHARLYKEGIEQ